MSKAILIIDIPSNFEEQLNNLTVKFGFNSYGDRILQVADYSSGEMIFFEYKSEKRLKLLPKKLEFKTDRLTLKSNVDEIDNYIKNLGYERVGNIHDTIGGFNACLEELLGEE